MWVPFRLGNPKRYPNKASRPATCPTPGAAIDPTFTRCCVAIDPTFTMSQLVPHFPSHSVAKDPNFL